MPRSGSVKCLNCHQFFQPHPRSKGRQRFCSHQDCQYASKRHSQQQWLNKPENRDYFSGPENVRRVQMWRLQHPGYSRKQQRKADKPSPLQEGLISQPVDITNEKEIVKAQALQELLSSQPVVLIGLIAHLTGAALQDDILAASRRLRQLGEDFLHPPTSGDSNHESSLTRSPPLP